MPDLLKKRCGFRGCPKTTRQRYCDEHAPLARQFYDRRRGSSADRGYDSAWERVAEHRRQLDCGLCQACLAEGLVTASSIVDHIIPIHVRPDWRLEIGNTQVMVKKFGMIVKSPEKGFPMKSPYLSIADQALETMRKLMVEFGLTPSSRSRIRVPPGGDEVDELDRFLETG